ncbi:MAG: transporter [Verrucomicrobiales bacterium]|jgi:predicted MFS family arabinose efflux permease|nr:transporter [Verrucomicrobiales bacterium]
MQTALERIWKSIGMVQTRPAAPRYAVRTLFFINGALFATWASRIPAIQAERGLSNTALGFALLAMALGAVIAMPASGFLLARFGSAKLCKTLAIVFCGLLPLLTIVPNQPLFVLCLFFFGAAHGALDVSMNARAVAVEKQSATPIMSSFHAFWSIGGLAGASLGSLVAAQELTPSEHFNIVALLLGLVTFTIFGDLNGSDEPAQANSARPAIFCWPNRATLALGLLALCVMIGEGAMADWSGIYLRSGVGASPSWAAAGYAFFSLAMAAGRLGGDALNLRFGPVKLARMGGVLAAGGLAMAIITQEIVLSLIGFVCVGAGFATVVPMVFSAAGKGHGPHAGIAVASVSTLGYLGFLLGPPSIGFAADLVGLRAALLIIVVTSAAIIPLAIALKHEAGRKTEAEGD